MSRHLTKSRFKVGYECPTKLFYLDDKTFGSNKLENPFLKALAEGGFQVGELAKIYHPLGIEIKSSDKLQAKDETIILLQQDSVTIFEATIGFNNLFIKVDILKKEKDQVELIEVKAKSFDSQEDNPFLNKTKLKSKCYEINSAWEPYLIDIAFQTYVFQKAFPQYKVDSYLMLVDKRAIATVDGLNQKFFLQKNKNNEVSVKVAPGTTLETVGAPLLKKVLVNPEVEILFKSQFEIGHSRILNFEQLVDLLSEICQKNLFYKPPVGGQCKTCEFRIDQEQINQGIKSGFEHCWTQAKNLNSEDCQKSFVFDIWNFRKADKLLAEGKIFLDQVVQEDIAPRASDKDKGLSPSERQWLQVQKAQENGCEPYLDLDGLKLEFAKWKFPLHFIDFETTMVAIPFHKGRHPYEQIAFQFSHHMVDSLGHIKHHDQYLCKEKGKFPNFEFVRALMKSLSADEGTIFCYASHENSVLYQIREQLLSATPEEVSDQKELLNFIESIAEPTQNSKDIWHARRPLVDMRKLVLKYFYHPRTKGSNSIKKVLPAVLYQSKQLQDKYSKPIYGTMDLPSLNFKDWIWIKKNSTGEVLDPYQLLPPIFTDLDLNEIEYSLMEGKIAEGGAAMTAYARMQFTEMSGFEFEKVAQALLKYCELDTFAMVLIYEYWKTEIEKMACDIN